MEWVAVWTPASNEIHLAPALPSGGIGRLACGVRGLARTEHLSADAPHCRGCLAWGARRELAESHR